MSLERPGASEIARRGWGTILGIGGLIGALLLVASMWVFGWGFWSRATADFRGETEKIEQIEGSGAFRIGASDSFFNRCASIQSFEDRIDILEDELEAGVSPERENQIRQALSAIQAQRAEEIRKYNADANNNYTVGKFRSENLPYQLDIDGETTCNLE